MTPRPTPGRPAVGAPTSTKSPMSAVPPAYPSPDSDDDDDNHKDIDNSDGGVSLLNTAIPEIQVASKDQNTGTDLPAATTGEATTAAPSAPAEQQQQQQQQLSAGDNKPNDDNRLIAYQADRPSSVNRRQSQHSQFAKSVLMSKVVSAEHARSVSDEYKNLEYTVSPTSVSPPRHGQTPFSHDGLKPLSTIKPAPHPHAKLGAHQGVGNALSDTPIPSTTTSPRILPNRGSSGGSTPRVRPTTLDVPGLTRSKVSPDGKIAERDVGSKLVVIMVGLPARGKSYITKKTCRYMNWVQHDTKIFNVGERRREATGSTSRRNSAAEHDKVNLSPNTRAAVAGVKQDIEDMRENPQPPASISIKPASPTEAPPLTLPSALLTSESVDEVVAKLDATQVGKNLPQIMIPTSPGAFPVAAMDQSADFFDPANQKAALIREQCALDTLNDLLDYILIGGGSVGILDATNSTLERRKLVMNHIRERAGNEINVLFVESVCRDESLLESNMRLKLSGPDYKGQDPFVALADFKKRVAMYEQRYVALGDYEETNNMPYVKLIDVGRKIVAHQIKGFLSAQVVSYLMNFNLAPRCIWVSRHGESTDNLSGRIGGDADLSPNGQKYAKALARFIGMQRKEWQIHQAEKAAHTHFPPHPGDHTPPNPHYHPEDDDDHDKNCCVWTSMLKRSIQSSEFFDEERYDVKQMRMLDELNAGIMEGMTYKEIQEKHADEYELRKRDKLQYRYPGPGGEGYLDVINRLRPVIVELERMTDHCLILTHRSVARVLLAYFLGLSRDDVARLEAPLGMLYRLEPKPYGVEFKAFCYNPERDTFDLLPDFKLKREQSIGA